MSPCHLFTDRAADERLVLAAGLRTPFARAGGAFAGEDAGHLGSALVRELLARGELDGGALDAVFLGGPPGLAREVALRAGLPADLPARTIARGAGSGVAAVASALCAIESGEAGACLCGAAECAGGGPSKEIELAAGLLRLARERSADAARELWSTWRRSRPEWGDAPSSGGDAAALRHAIAMTDRRTTVAAEALARSFGITREAADALARSSHRRAARARREGLFEDEIAPWLPLGAPEGSRALRDDDGVREALSLETLAVLDPIHVVPDGAATAGNTAEAADGAVALVVATRARAGALGLEPLAEVHAWATAGIDPRRGGLSPVFATARVLEATGVELEELRCVELEETFAGETLACTRALSSERFAREELGRRAAVGELDPERLNPDGGAIAFGCPAGAGGARLVLAVARRLRREGGGFGLVTLDFGGGLGGAMLLARAPS